MSEKHTIAGIPASKFINRRVRIIRQGGGHRIAATMVGLEGDKAVVKPPNHKGTEKVPLSSIHPWWSQNPDLKADYNSLPEEAKDSTVAEDNFGENAQPSDLKGVFEQARPAIKLPGMELPPGIDFMRLNNAVQELIEAMLEEEEVRQLLKPAQQKQAAVRTVMEKLGVRFK